MAAVRPTVAAVGVLGSAMGASRPHMVAVGPIVAAGWGGELWGHMLVLDFPPMNISIPWTILTSTLVNLSITSARLTSGQGITKLSYMLMLGLPPMKKKRRRQY